MLLRLSMCYILFLNLWYAQSVKVLTCRVRDSLMQLHMGHALCAVLLLFDHIFPSKLVKGDGHVPEAIHSRTSLYLSYKNVE